MKQWFLVEVELGNLTAPDDYTALDVEYAMKNGSRFGGWYDDTARVSVVPERLAYQLQQALDQPHEPD